MSDLIPTGATEIIEAFVTGITGLALTGLTDIAADIRRASDGKLYDFDDHTFKDAGWTIRQLALPETDAATQAGWYRYSWDTSAITNPVDDDVYTVTIRQTTLTSAYNVPQVGTIRSGGFVDTIATNLDTTVGSRLPTSSYVNPPSIAGLALESTLTAMKGASFDTATDSLRALRARGDSAWITATGFAVAGDDMALTDGALTAVQAKILDDATPFHGASVASILAFGAPPAAATVATQVWATAHGTPSVNTFGWLVWRHAQWGTEIADKAIVGQDLLLRSLDLATTYATVRLRDKDGGVINPAVGEPARFDP